MKLFKGLILCITCFILVSCNTSHENNHPNTNSYKDDTTVSKNNEDSYQDNEQDDEVDKNYKIEGSDQIVSRAIAAKMIALANYDKSFIDTRDREIEFKDTTPDEWYDKYINTVVVDEWMSGKEDKFYPLEPLTFSELQLILKTFDMSLKQVNLNDDYRENQAVTQGQWMNFIDGLLNELEDQDGVVEKDMIVFATPSISSDLGAWKMATDLGLYSFEGLAMDTYLDNEIKVQVRGNEILSIRKIVQLEPVLTNAYIESTGDTTLRVFMGGISRNIGIDASLMNQLKADVIADLHIENHNVKNIHLKENKFTDVVKLINSSTVDFKEKGQFPVTKDVKIYSKVNNLKWKGLSHVIVGYQTAQFVLNDEQEICAIIIDNSVHLSNIRVLINTTNFKEKKHQEVKLKATSDYQIITGDETYTYSKDDVFTVSAHDDFFKTSHRLYVQPVGNGKIILDHIKRGYGSHKYSPEYRGTVELYKSEEGILIVNELPIEEYLYAVVPSEMPTSYGLEASKVQAVCARSYAYTQFYANRYCHYGAHVDDSVSCQVYNNSKENETSIKAVNQTARQGLKYNNRVVSANFFSTSCGYTADSGDVWANYKKQFPTTTPEYLSGKPQYEENTHGDLADETAFRAFITNKELMSYDKDFSWYRWTVEMTREQLEKSIKSSINKRYLASPKMVKTLDENDIFRSRMIDSIGDLNDLWVYSRGSSGIITEMMVESSSGTYKIATEYNIRLLLAPKSHTSDEDSIMVFRNDESKQKNMGLLPSAFFVMDKVYNGDNQLIKVIFRGGGYGHGVGMSQNGVKGMVDLGHQYLDILKHYYSGTEVTEIY